MSTQVIHSRTHPVVMVGSVIGILALLAMVAFLPSEMEHSQPAQEVTDQHAAKYEARAQAIAWVTNHANDPSSVKIWSTGGVRDPESGLNVFHVDFTATNGFGGPSRNLFGLVISDAGKVIEVKDEHSGKLYVGNGRE